MDHETNNISRLTAGSIKVLIGLAALAGIALAGYLAFAAIPPSAWHTATTPSIHDTASPFAESLDKQYWIVFWMAMVVFVVVEAMILYAALGFRRKEGDGEPKQTHGNNTMEVIWTIGPVIIVLYLAYMSYGTMRENYVSREAMAGGGEILEIEAIGMQWWWAFEYPEGFETATEMVVPVGRPVRVNLETADVLHSFWVPELAGKMDAVPGERDGGYGQNFVWFTAERTGRFEGQCAELCGTQHSGMRFSVIVVEEDEYEAWASAMAIVPEEPQEYLEALAFQDPKRHAQIMGLPEPEGDAAKASEVPSSMDTAEYRGWKSVSGACVACHSVDGHSLISVNESLPRKFGPNLTRTATRTSLAGGVIAHTAENVEAWMLNPDSQKIGTLMGTFINTGSDEGNSAQAQEIIAYLTSLKLDDGVMSPVFDTEPPPRAIPPAYPELQHLLDTDEHVDEHAGNTVTEDDSHLESSR